MASSALYVQLADSIGAAFVSSEPETCAQFSVQGCAPACVVAPGTVDELALVMEAAHAHGALVAPWGGGTQQAIGNPPEQLDLVVRTERLQRVLIHEPADLTISVEAGMTLGMLRSHLAARNQMLPIDPPLPDHATIGGLIATAMDGPRRLSYGTLRDLLIGITVVEANGRISKAGGMVVKNVSGFDMMKLYLGSFGTLAIVAAANFKLLPLPRDGALVLCAFPERRAAFRFLEALHNSQLTPAAAEYLGAGALTQLGLGGACAVALLVEGLPQAVARHIRDLGELASQHGGTAETHEDRERMWQAIADLPQVAQLAPDEAVLKIATLPGELEDTLGRVEALGTAHVSISARALDGVAYARIQGLGQEQLASFVASMPGVQWVATPMKGVARWGALNDGTDVMQRIKTEFDPQNILNRGRFVVPV